MQESDRYPFQQQRRDVYDEILNVLNGGDLSWNTPEFVRRLIVSLEFQRVKSMTPEEFEESTRDYPPIDVISKVLVLINTDISWGIFLDIAPEDDIYAVASSNIITGRRLEQIKEGIRGRSDVSDGLIAALDELTTSEVSRFDRDIFEEIVLNTDTIEEQKTLYESKVVFRQILDNPEVLKHLANKAVRDHADDLLLGMNQEKYTPIVLDRYNNFWDYFVWYTDTFYSSKYCPTKSNRVACILGAIKRDDLEMFKKTYTAYLQDPSYNSYLNPIDYANSPKIANYIINEVDPLRAGPGAVLALAAMFSDAETVRRILDDPQLMWTQENLGFGIVIEDVVRACAMLYSRKEPDEEVKVYLMEQIRMFVEAGTPLYLSGFVSIVTSLREIRHTRWLNDMTLSLISKAGGNANILLNFFFLVKLGLLKYAQVLVTTENISSPITIDVDTALRVIPDDIPPSELKGFIDFILHLITYEMYDTVSEKVKRVIDECVEEYKESSTRSLDIPLTMKRTTT